MSRSQFVEFGNNGFWAYDVALGVFLKHLIDAAEASEHANTKWLSCAVSQWRVQACISDYGMTLDSDWSAAQRQTFIELVEEACTSLALRESIPEEEIVRWQLLNDLHISTRGSTEVLTAPVVELGHALIALVLGELPELAEGQTWFYGAPTCRQVWNRSR